MPKIIKNGLLYYNQAFHNQDLLIIDNKIAQVSANINPNLYPQAIVYDASKQIVIPSFCDVHVHFRFPGQTYKEDISSGVAAAINGGYTSVVMMPNTIPVIDNKQTIDLITKVASKQPIMVKMYGAATINQKGVKPCDFSQLLTSGVVAFSDDGYGIQNSEVMKQILHQSQSQGFILAAHLEDNNHQVKTTKNYKKIPRASIETKMEWKQAQRDVELLKNYPQARYHMCHVSALETIEILAKAKRQGLKITAEVSPHHLVLSQDMIDKDDGTWKVNPPLKARKHCQALVKALNKGVIDIIASDHAPHSFEEKLVSFYQAPPGMIGLDFTFAMLYTHLVKTKKVKLETIIQAMTINPRQIFNLPQVAIQVGSSADLAIIDLDQGVVINKKYLKSKACNTPLLNQKLWGMVTHLFYQGKLLKGA